MNLFKIKKGKYIIPIHLIIFLYFFYKSSKNKLINNNNKLKFFIGGLGGLVFSNFMEYFVHNTLFHKIPKKISNNFYYIVHGHHHRKPSDIPFIPLAQTLFIYLITYFSWSNIFKYIKKIRNKKPELKDNNNNNLTNFMVGGSSGFLIFELVHWLIHKPKIINKIKIFKPMLDFHWSHHDISNCAYTFTSPFWDWLFNTLPEKSKYYKWKNIPIPLPIIPFIISYLIT